MRTLTEHRINPVNDLVDVTANDLPGGEPAAYTIKVPDAPPTLLRFQLGPIAEVGVNGLTNEALLAIVMDRLRWFQQGRYSCRENACAITKIEEALHWMHARTLGRMQRGVEGTHKV